MRLWESPSLPWRWLSISLSECLQPAQLNRLREQPPPLASRRPPKPLPPALRWRASCRVLTSRLKASSMLSLKQTHPVSHTRAALLRVGLNAAGSSNVSVSPQVYPLFCKTWRTPLPHTPEAPQNHQGSKFFSVLPTQKLDPLWLTTAAEIPGKGRKTDSSRHRRRRHRLLLLSHPPLTPQLLLSLPPAWNQKSIVSCRAIQTLVLVSVMTVPTGWMGRQSETRPPAPPPKMRSWTPPGVYQSQEEPPCHPQPTATTRGTL